MSVEPAGEVEDRTGPPTLRDNAAHFGKRSAVMTYEYLKLGPNDLQRMRGLLAAFAEAFDEPNTYLSAQPGDSYLRNLLSQNHFIAVTAVNGDEVVGGLTAYVLDKFEQERSEIYIYDLAVAKAHRRKGMATGLIRFLQNIAMSYNAWVIFVQADTSDKAAIKLYASLGRREDVHHFDIPVRIGLAHPDVG